MSIDLTPEIRPPPAPENVTFAVPLTCIDAGENVPVALSVVGSETLISAFVPLGTIPPSQFAPLQRSPSPAAPVHDHGSPVAR